VDHITIEPLSRHEDLIPICAHWSYSQWYITRDITFDMVLRAYGKRASEKGSERVFVALHDDFPVGMVSLKENDLWHRKDLSPWLASLFVIPQYRKKGIGEELIKGCIDHARENNFKTLHLFIDYTESQKLFPYYQKRGWSFMEDAIDNDGFATKILSYDLS
jgi:GNAT superfamily N-acetyltransferase